MIAWVQLIALVTASSAVLVLLGLPTPLLFGGLVGALIYALARPAQPLKLPTPWFIAGQAIVGVIVGQVIDFNDLASLGSEWLVVTGVGCFSLVVSVAVGQLLVRHGATRVTATFSSVAGGAAGLTALASDLGADDRVVAVLQYLRLLIVLVTLPVVVSLGFGIRGDGVEVATQPEDWLIGVAFVVIAATVGYYGGRLIHLPSAAILGPMVMAAVLHLVPWFADAEVPTLLVAAGYLAIGVQVGLKFTVASVRAIGAMVPTALLTIAVTIAACGALGWLLTLTTSASGMDAYLATTPGGIYAVLGTAAETGADAGFVAASQVIRVLVILGSAPFLAAWLRRRDSPE